MENDKLNEILFGTAEERPMRLVSGSIGLLFSLFMAHYFYKKDRSFWMWFFAVGATSSLVGLIVTAGGLHLKKKETITDSLPNPLATPNTPSPANPRNAPTTATQWSWAEYQRRLLDGTL